MGKYPLTYEEFKYIYSKVPRLTVELIIKTDEGVLLTKRAVEPYIGQWHIPGGTVYRGEFMEDAVNRVAMDELGVKVKIVKFIDFIRYPNHHKISGWDWPVGAAYLLEIVEGKPQPSEQGSEIKYFKSVPEDIVPDQGEYLERFVFGRANNTKL